MIPDNIQDNTFDFQYIQMQQPSVEQTDSLYSTTSGSFPSHIRSISPKMDTRLTIDREQVKSSKCSSRTVYIILIAIFLLSSSIAIAVVIHEIRVIQAAGRLQTFIHMNSHRTTTVSPLVTQSPQQTMEVDVNQWTTPYITRYDNVPTDQRTSCYKKCTMYGHNKFISNCISGYCECQGQYYQLKSCLPTVNGCTINKEYYSRNTFLWHAAATSYTCSVKSTITDTKTVDKKIYIVSIHGNHFEKSTAVRIVDNSSKTDNITLVLASHFPVKWEIDPRNTSVSNIVLLSDQELTASQVTLTSQNGDVTPEVKHMFTPVGFGDDRHSYTVEMLQSVTENIGPITKFLGADFADKIILDATD
ncbi:G-protein coupled receptor Fz Smo [Mactra antiquata]